MLPVPVDHTVGLLCTNDAQGIDSCIRGRQVGVLARTPSEASSRTLTPSKKLAHAGKKNSISELEIAAPANQITTTLHHSSHWKSQLD